MVAAVVVVVVATGCQPPFGGPSAQPAPASAGTSAPSSAAIPTTATDATAQPATQPATGSATTAAPPPSTSPPAPRQPTAPATPRPSAAPSTTRPASGPVPVGPGRIRPGVAYSGPATHYGADGGGNCMFDRLSDPAMPVVAMNELDYENARACGAYLEVTGPGGSTVVKVTDRCPECGAGHLDLSRQAFDRIAGGVPGLVNVTWRLVSPAGLGPVQYRIKDGSSAYWLAIQVREHRNPVVSLEVRVNGTWVALAREMWNHFVAPQGLGPGPFTVRITDLYGEQLVHTVKLAPETVQTAESQFAQH
ncbi:expansin EXLX1 family cellulose-binding protein [Frankia nepalensis]|uniref:expansin EXLX1 family cellulose-binding protein n=1 Tax=Frankia nepalensis TaxID=1836974 RepID=UPI0027DE223F|nr:expansin EXLX1 family cellulose-binding protein [Frankia nepalensis]